MRSTALLVLAALLLLALAPSAALAHGIIVVDGDVIVVSPTPPDRRMPPRHVPNPVRLKDHRVEGTLHGRIADVRVEQVFHNDTPRQLEGTYLFPLPEGASVARFAMTMGGKMVEGEIMAADRARQIYEDIVRRRRDPGLLEYMGRGLFKARVFPIEPNADLTIQLSFQQVLPEDAGTLEFRYPLATDRLHGTPVENALVSLKIDSDVDLKAIYSPSHDVAVVRDGNRKAHVSYERAGRRQEHDFLLYVGRSPEDVGFSFLSHKAAGEDGTFLAVLAPSSDVPADQLAPKDVVYVLDTSGSMAQDDKIGQARRALEYGVRVLNPQDRFAILAFSGAVRPFRDGLVEASKELKDAAGNWIQALQAQGGTNIEEALDTALSMRSDRLFMVVFITDGRPTIGLRDPDQLVQQVKAKNAANVRVFTFGVGFDLDVRLLDRIADATRASRDYVMPKEDIELATSRFFRKVNQPVLSDVTVEFGAGVHDVYPRELSDLFAGGQVLVMGRYGEPGDRVIRLKGRLGDKQVVHEYEATFSGQEALPYLPRLWAHRKVAYLLDAIRLNGEDKELVDEVVRLATRYGIVTPYTAGLVVEESELAGREGAVTFDGRSDRLRRRLEAQGSGGGAGGLAPPAAGRPGDSGAPTPGAAAPAEPAAEAKASEALQRLKDKGGFRSGDEEDGAEADDFGMRAAEKRVQAVADKTFLLAGDGRWIDTAWDGKGEPTKVEAYSAAWATLLAKGKHVAKYLALGERVLVVVDGQAYEVVPPAAPPAK